MPNLNERDVIAWLAEWRGISTADWPPSLRTIEQQNGLPESLAGLGDAFQGDNPSRATLICELLRTGPQANSLKSVIAQLGAARALRVLHWLSELDLPESRALLDTMLRDRDSEGGAICALINALRRRATLNSIFASDRLAALERACAATLQEDV